MDNQTSEQSAVALAELAAASLFGHGSVLSGVGAKHEALPSVRNHAALMEDHTFFVTPSGMADIEVMDYQANLRRLGLTLTRQVVSFADIQTIYHGTSPSEKNLEVREKETEEQDFSLTMLEEAAKLHASDIHIVIRAKLAVIKYRIMGDLEIKFKIRADRGRTIIRTIFNSLCDVTGTNYDEFKNQSARLASQYCAPFGLYEARIATGPTDKGVGMFIRLHYDHGSDPRSLEELGYTSEQTRQIERITERTSGIVLISGPTGSGKTTTLQNHLRRMFIDAGGKRNLLTIEDPVELPIEGSVQVVVRQGNGTRADDELKWTEAIESAMRWDPDWILIGELRLLATMHAAVTCAQTNHLTFGTLHASNAVACLDRLRDTGISLTSLREYGLFVGFGNQSIVATVCPHCSRPFEEAKSELSDGLREKVEQLCTPGTVRLRGEGCDRCYKGASGRTVCAELVEPTATFFDVYAKSGSTAARRYWIDEMDGFTKCQHMISKINAGQVDPRDAERMVLPLDEDVVFFSQNITHSLGESKRQRTGNRGTSVSRIGRSARKLSRRVGVVEQAR